MATFTLIGPRPWFNQAGQGARRQGRVLSHAGLSLLLTLSLLPALFGPAASQATASSSPGGGLWLSPAELAVLPTDSKSFSDLKSVAYGSLEPTDISNQDSQHNTRTMATALVAARLDSDPLRAKVRDAIAAVIGTETGDTGPHSTGNRILGVARNLASYVIAADLIRLRDFDSRADARFRAWLAPLRTKSLASGSTSLVEHDEKDAGNWGAYAGASRAAASLYLGDSTDVARSAAALRGWTGDRTAEMFTYRSSRDYSWQCGYPETSRYVPVNPLGCARNGHSLDGVMAEDMRRGGSYQWPPVFTSYPRENLVGRTIEAELLYRAGYPVWSWGDLAFLRVVNRQLSLSQYDSQWYEPRINAYWIIAKRYGVHLPLEGPSKGRTVIGVDWTHR